MVEITDFFSDAAGNNALGPPDGLPETTSNVQDINNWARENQAATRRQWNAGGWFEYGDGSGPYTAAFLAVNRFEIQGVDVSTRYTPNSKIRITQGATILFGIVSAVVFTAGDTEVTVILEAGVIANATIDRVELGAVADQNPTPIDTLIRDADRDTSVSVEQSPDDDAIVGEADGIQVFRHTTQGGQLPVQPGFSYFDDGVVQQGNVTGAGARYQVKFPAKNFERGSMMNVAFDTMTAVLPGVYHVDVMLSLQNVDERATEINMEIEHSDGRFYRWERDVADLAQNISNYPVAQSRKIDMLQGQTLKIFLQVSGMPGNNVDLIGSTDRNRCEWGVWFLG